MVQVSVTDAAGNESAAVDVTMDSQAPDAPTEVALDKDGVVTGKGEPGATVAVTDQNGEVIGSGIVDDNGVFEVTVDPVPADGDVVQVSVTDAAGNVSDAVGVTMPHAIQLLDDYFTAKLNVEPTELDTKAQSDSRLSVIDLGGLWDAFFDGAPRFSFKVEEGQSATSEISVSSSSVISVLDNVKVQLRVKDENGNWEVLDESGSGSLIDVLGIFSDTVKFTIKDLPPGEYQVIAAVRGLTILGTTKVEGSTTFYDHTEVGSYTATSVSGNVMENDIANEDSKVTHINGEPLNAEGTTIFGGEYGTLTISADGGFTYKPYSSDGSSIGQVETFKYTVQTANGSSKTAKLQIRIDSDGQGLKWSEDFTQPAEVDVVANSNAGETVIDSDYRVTQGGASQKAPSQSIDGIFGGAVTKTTSVSFTVDPNSKANVKITASSPDELLVSDSLKVTVTGPSGFSKTYTGTGGLLSNLTIQEMLQELEAGNYTVTATYQRSATGSGGKLELGYETQSVTYLDEYVVKSVEPATGNVLADDSLGSTYTKFLIKDANGDFIQVVNGTEVDGQHGTLTINANGDYTYHPKPVLGEIGHQDVFEYRLEHPNGKKSDASLTIDIEHGNGPYVPEPESAMVDLSNVEFLAGDDADEPEPFNLTLNDVIATDENNKVPFFIDSDESEQEFAPANTDNVATETAAFDVSPVVDPLDDLLEQPQTLI